MRIRADRKSLKHLVRCPPPRGRRMLPLIRSRSFGRSCSPHNRSLPISTTHNHSHLASVLSFHLQAPAFLLTLASAPPISSAMASVTMAASSLTAFVAAPGATSSSSTAFSAFSTVRMAPLGVNRRLAVVAMAQPNQTKTGGLDQQVADSIKNAQEACEEDPTSAPCAVAWDEVEELSAAAKDQQLSSKANSDPLEKFCADQPEADECRVYED